MIDNSKIMYSISIEDAQNVAEQEIGRKLTKKELEIVEDKIGDYMDWYEAINMAICHMISNQKKTTAQCKRKE